MFYYALLVSLCQHLALIPAHPVYNSNTASTSGRFSIPIHSNQRSNIASLDKRSTGDAESYFKPPASAWSSIRLGKQNASVILDTGSSDTWVYSTHNDPASYYNGLGNISLYNSANSNNTFQEISDSHFSVTYASNSGTFEGPMGSDLMTIGTTAPVRQAFGLVDTPEKSKDLSTWDTQGVLGLGIGDAGVSSYPRQKTWLENVLPTLDEKLFTLTVNSEGSGKWNFGYIDESQYSGPIVYAPLGACSTSGWWALDGLSVTWSSLNFTADNIGHSLDCVQIDSGTDVMVMSSHVVEAYYKNVPSALQINGYSGVYGFPCSTKLPDLTLQLGWIGSQYMTTVSGEHMNMGPASADKKICYGALTNSSTSQTMLGHIFFKSHFVVFDVGKNRLGFANSTI